MKVRTELVDLPSISKVLGNIHKVPMKQWRKWCPAAQWTFNNMMRMLNNPRLITHPDYERAAEEYWNTIRWNASWIAADLEQARLSGDQW
jgi:hypothetical protein